MKRATNYRQGALGPLQRKTFGAVLRQTLRQHVPTLGPLTARVLADHIQKVMAPYFPSTARLRMGQMLWLAVDVRETAGYGKPIEDCKLKPVMLQAVAEEDIQSLLDGQTRRQVRKNACVRLCRQAYEQGAVLTLTDVAAILQIAPTTVHQCLQEYEHMHPGQLVPRRGNIHDMGPTLTHKKIICQKVIREGLSIGQTAQATHHSPEAVTRYIQDYRRVAACQKHGMTIQQAAYATGLSLRLATQYQDLIHSNTPQPAGEKEAR
jgi:AraC-like DNA-binding protein